MAMMCLAFALDGARVVSGGVDGTARVWDPVTGQELARFGADKEVVSCVAFSHDRRGQRLQELEVGEEVGI
jgi:WD40 repeat protein